jgi:NADH:ubiquinone reductase (H+-translocating)
MNRIVVLGSGFAGLWSAVGAARALEQFGIARDEVEVTLVNRDPWHTIRVRDYESDLSDVRVPLESVLAPIGVRHHEAEVVEFDFSRRQIICSRHGSTQALAYDRLVFALGSQLARPSIPGLAQHAFDVDTYDNGMRLNAHVESLAARSPSAEQYTALVVGAGLTGIEAATEMVTKLRVAIQRTNGIANLSKPRVIIADHRLRIGSDMGDEAVPVIKQALAWSGIEMRTGVSVAAVDGHSATLSTGERIPAATVIWCAGMRANPLTALFPVQHDHLGRIPVDPFMKVKGMDGVFAAGDSAFAMVDDTHVSVMSCQHARPMGRFAGYNVVVDLLGKAMLPLRIDWYVTVLDLGEWGALYAQGWDRHVVATAQAAKKTKRIINCDRIYPPRSGSRDEIFAAAEPVVQQPPGLFH